MFLRFTTDGFSHDPQPVLVHVERLNEVRPARVRKRGSTFNRPEDFEIRGTYLTFAGGAEEAVIHVAESFDEVCRRLLGNPRSLADAL